MLKIKRMIFWDFDGVIKESVEIKTNAFVQLFQPFGIEVAKRVKEHHIAHGGMSRFKKIPLYLQWGGEAATESQINEYCEEFSQLVVQGVIESPWVDGVEEFLRNNTYHQIFILVSATPQQELEQILHALDLTSCFAEIFGSPVDKKDAIRKTLAAYKINPNDCLMIGDARADFDAAEANRVPFLLRRHETNINVFTGYSGDSVKDFTLL